MRGATMELRVRVTRTLHQKLKERARQEHRSLGSQVEYLLEQLFQVDSAEARK